MKRWTLRLLPLVIPCLVTSLGGREHDLSSSPVLQKYLDRPTETLTSYKGTRRLEAHNDRFNVDGWMEVTTTLSEQGFAWQVTEEGGSSYIRNKVLRNTLKIEEDAVTRDDPTKAAVAETNYTFSEAPPDASVEVPPGLARFLITPKREDMLLLEGAMWLASTDGDLIQVDGRMSKKPSFWTHTVDIVRRYTRVAGVRVPVEVTSTAHVRVAGRSTFRMTFRYESVNGTSVETAGIR